MKTRKNKGISTFIATLLLMVLAVSAGVVIYAYTMGYLGGFGGTEQLGAMSIDESSANETNNNITAYVRNIGKTSIVFDLAYVDGEQVDFDTEKATAIYPPDTTALAEGKIATVQINCGDLSFDIQAGNTYEVKLVAEDNTQTSFSVKAK